MQVSAATRAGLFYTFAFLAGVGGIGFAVARFSALAHAIRAGAPLVTLYPIDAVGFTIGLSCLAFAAMALIPVPNATASRHQSNNLRKNGSPIDWPMVCLAAVVVGLVLSGFAPKVATFVTSTAVERRGYIACPPPSDDSRPPLRWTLPTPGSPLAHCPRSWRDA